MNHNISINYIKKTTSSIPIKNVVFFKDELNLIIDHKFLMSSLIFLKYHVLCQFKILTLISATDYIHQKKRFELLYELLSLRFSNRVRLKVKLEEILGVPSCEYIFPSANWHECEIWDMFGIFFFNHSNLRRILTDYGFEGSPLRKDFPLSGFIELRYSEIYKRIVNEPLELAQEYRTFKFFSPWF